MIECMFDELDDAGVVEAMGSAACEENAACGRRLMAIGELYVRRALVDDSVSRLRRRHIEARYR
jgi:hypothetical protein